MPSLMDFDEDIENKRLISIEYTSHNIQEEICFSMNEKGIALDSLCFISQVPQEKVTKFLAGEVDLELKELSKILYTLGLQLTTTKV